MGAIEQAYNGLFIVSIIIVALLIFLCLCRAIKGPRVADRIVSANMIGTMTIIIIAILSVLLKESYLLDVCLIYAMISFLAVVVLTKVYQGAYIERMEAKKVKEAEEEKKSNQEIDQEIHQQIHQQIHKEVNQVGHKALDQEEVLEEALTKVKDKAKKEGTSC